MWTTPISAEDNSIWKVGSSITYKYEYLLQSYNSTSGNNYVVNYLENAHLTYLATQIDSSFVTFKVTLNDLDPTYVKVFRDNSTDPTGKPYFMWVDTSNFEAGSPSNLKDRITLGGSYFYEAFSVVDSSSISIDGQTLIYWKLTIPRAQYKTDNYTYSVKERTIRIADGSGIQIAGNYHVLSYQNISGVVTPVTDLSWVVNAVSFNNLSLNPSKASPLVIGAFILMVILILYLLYRSPRIQKLIHRK